MARFRLPGGNVPGNGVYFWNATKDKIRTRMAIINEDIWPMPSALGNVPPDPALQRTAFSQMMLDGRVVHRDILEEIYAEVNEMYGTDIPVP